MQQPGLGLHYPEQNQLTGRDEGALQPLLPAEGSVHTGWGDAQTRSGRGERERKRKGGGGGKMCGNGSFTCAGIKRRS